MYCPRCAAQCIDDAKFCRACGTDLKAVGLALAKGGKGEVKSPKVEKNWAEKRGKGVRDAVAGATLLGATLLIGLAFSLFSDHPDQMIIWAGIFGWMACWGVISVASGLGAIMQAASMSNMESKTVLPQPVDEPVTVPDTDPLDSRSSPALSVAENTTRSLGTAPKEYVAKE